MLNFKSTTGDKQFRWKCRNQEFFTFAILLFRWMTTKYEIFTTSLPITLYNVLLKWSFILSMCMNLKKQKHSQKGYIFFPLILTQGLLAIEMLVKLVRFTNWDISFKSLILLLERVKFVKLIGKNLSHCTKWFILLLWRHSSWNMRKIDHKHPIWKYATYFEILKKRKIVYVYYTILR